MKFFIALLKFFIHPLLSIPFIFKTQQKMNNYSSVRNEFLDYLDVKDKKILEIGCSTGNASKVIVDFKNNDYIGIDTHAGYIELAKKNYPIGNFKKMDGRSQDFEDNFFDLILINSMLHHVNDKDGVLIFKEAERVLKVNGKILIAEPMFSNNDRLSTFLLMLDRGDFIRSFDGYKKLFLNLKIERQRFFRFTRHNFASFV
ncbi:class I SAM-dependent methyltransferase, partial [Candidatus Pelagibacter ubique]|nr:class I SAM-dependent methyltransferase [Candidatus Pelagibacter ubique]